MKTQFPASSHSRRAIMLIDCIVYFGLFFVVLTLSFPLFYTCWDGSLSLRRNTDEISATCRVGEQWRADVRKANAPIRIEKSSGDELFYIPSKSGEVAYKFSQHSIYRRANGTSDWSEILTRIQSSHIATDHRQLSTAWRWEIELITRHKASRMRPLFTFEAVATPGVKP